MTQYSLGAEG